VGQQILNHPTELNNIDEEVTMSNEPHSMRVQLEPIAGPVSEGQAGNGFRSLSELPPPDE